MKRRIDGCRTSGACESLRLPIPVDFSASETWRGSLDIERDLIRAADSNVRRPAHSARDATQERYRMNAGRFDAIAKALNTSRSRRWTLGGLLAGMISLLAAVDPDEVWSAKSGKCEQPCGACERCDKGKCQKKNGKKRCRKGKCKPLARLPACAPRQMRNPVTCGCCSINGQTCTPPGPNSTCCSGRCGANGSSSGIDFCAGRFGGQACDFSEQCLSGICNNGTCTTD